MNFVNVQVDGKGKVLLQVSNCTNVETRWGFFLTDGESAWDGGFGIADNRSVRTTKRTSRAVEKAKKALEGGYADVDLLRYSFGYLDEEYM